MSEISEKAKGLIYNLKYREYTTRNTPTRWNKNLEKTARAELDNYIAELSQALGLITTLKPTMVMDADHPLEMAKEVVEYVTARIAELEAEKECEMRVFKDGNAWCFVLPDFQDLQVSSSVWMKEGVLDKIYKELRSERDERRSN